MKDLFHRFSTKVSLVTGSAYAFIVALVVIFVWIVSGPIFHFSDTWQLVINTGTTIVTFLMVFLIQNTQNRDSRAVQLKLDELIRSTTSASDLFVDLEDLSDDDLDALNEEFKKLHDAFASKPIPSLHKLHEKIVLEHTRRFREKH